MTAVKRALFTKAELPERRSASKNAGFQYVQGGHPCHFAALKRSSIFIVSIFLGIENPNRRFKFSAEKENYAWAAMNLRLKVYTEQFSQKNNAYFCPR